MSASHRPLSLATRLTLLFGVTAAIVFPVFGWVISQSMERHFEEGDTRELEVIADAIQAALAEQLGRDDLQQFAQRFDDILVGHHSASLAIVDRDGHLAYASERSPRLAPWASEAAKMTGEVTMRSQGGRTYRLLARPVQAWPGSAQAIVVAVPIDHHLEFLTTFRRTLWLMIASSIAIMSVMGWLAVRQGHAPLREIVGRIRRISGSELGGTIPPESVPRELTDLAESFNAMLARVNSSFRQLTNFNADIAHELRTPITNLMTQTQVALSKARTVDAYREVLYSNIEEYERMANMVGDMLFLAQSDNGAGLTEAAAVALGAEARSLLEYYEGWAEERGVTLALDGEAEAVGDRRMLQRALGNLISNAVRHTAAGGTVRTALEMPDGAARISVTNPGADIPSEHLPKLFDRFYRADAARARGDQGAGLGLAIAKAIVETHGGRIEVRSEAGLTTFTIYLPGARRQS